MIFGVVLRGEGRSAVAVEIEAPGDSCCSVSAAGRASQTGRGTGDEVVIAHRPVWHLTWSAV